MYLSDLLEAKKACLTVLDELTTNLKNYFHNTSELYVYLNKIEEIIDSLSILDKQIQRIYSTTYVTETETISDLYSYVNGLDKKINILYNLIVDSQTKEIEEGIDFNLNHTLILKSIQNYEDIRDSLLEKIEDYVSKTKVK